MQRKEACSVPLLAGEPCQPSPLNSYILNYVILRNKVQSQFIKSMHPRGGCGGGGRGAISNSKTATDPTQLIARMSQKTKHLFKGKS